MKVMEGTRSAATWQSGRRNESGSSAEASHRPRQLGALGARFTERTAVNEGRRQDDLPEGSLRLFDPCVDEFYRRTNSSRSKPTVASENTGHAASGRSSKPVMDTSSRDSDAGRGAVVNGSDA